jgi:hypothetical protein
VEKMASQNARRPWSNADINALKQLAALNTPTHFIALKLKRTPQAIYSQASRLQVPLKQANQSKAR